VHSQIAWARPILENVRQKIPLKNPYLLVKRKRFFLMITSAYTRMRYFFTTKNDNAHGYRLDQPEFALCLVRLIRWSIVRLKEAGRFS